MNVFICQMCGHIEFKDAPGNCPVCGAPKDQFKQNDNIFKESREKSPEAESKHIPAIEVNKTCGLIPEEGCTDVIVRIGSTLHPMKEEHYIQFIECYVDEKYVGQAKLTPWTNPAACFHLKAEGSSVTIVENCNIHGYWMAEAEM